jgi:two-component system, OmpR family, phosphate regulon sensor histidine kinase PhoR
LLTAMQRSKTEMRSSPRMGRPRDKESRERELQRVNDFHAALLAMAGHDLRQPLQVIVSTHAWFSRRLTEPTDRDRLERGGQAIMRLIRQLDHLVQALRLHERAEGADPLPIPLEPLLLSIAREHADEARCKVIEFRVVPSRLVVMSDEVLLHGMLSNLVRNALKYTGCGGKVLVGCRRRGRALRIEVHDTGSGIAPDDLARIFDAFHQVGSIHSDGLGLGLFIVRRSADALGHRLEVESTFGAGSCFSVLTEKPVSHVVTTGSALA